MISIEVMHKLYYLVYGKKADNVNDATISLITSGHVVSERTFFGREYQLTTPGVETLVNSCVNKILK